MSSRNRVVIVVAFKDGKFLMVRNPFRGWEFPGGKVEGGENEIEAIIREVREEAGAEIDRPVKVLKNEELVVFTAKILKFSGEGEFPRRLFDSIPSELAFPREEAELFLSLSKRIWR